MYKFVKFVATLKKYDIKFFFTPLFCCYFWILDPGSEIRDLGLGKYQDSGSRIRDKHPGSATLLVDMFT